MTPAQLDDLLVEPMARAICAVEFDGDVDSWDRLPADDSERKVWRREHGYEGLCVKSEYRSAARAAMAAIRAALAANGLFIGPEVATEGMLEAVKPFPAHLVSADPDHPDHIAMRAATMADQFSVKTLWSDLVTAWQRGDGTRANVTQIRAIARASVWVIVKGMPS